ncbi:MAG: ATP-dependent Clp protease ATP-binding subunit [Candidatus Levybacteria bacterium]|nr:ATP-dependent Clp protease ATP-binding subunit [Candidatus Levybacteria bacterium]
MKHFAKIYSIYNRLSAKLLRIIIFAWLLWLVYLSLSFNFSLTTASEVPIFILSIFLMWEIFFHFKISRIPPALEVKDNPSAGSGQVDVYSSFTIEALSTFSPFSTKDIVKILLGKPQIKFLLRKGNIQEKEVSFIDITKETLAKLAFENSKNMKGKYVTTMDIFAAYLLMTEDETKILFKKELKKEELLHILYWVKNTYQKEENREPFKIKFWGEGIGEGWVSGWTVETNKYVVDITKDALTFKPLLLGREEQFREVVETLSKNKSVMLVGEPGSGKSSLVNSLAFESFVGDIKGNLYHQRFFQISVDSLLAGIQSQGQLEERLNNVISELTHSGNIIVYIPNFENVLGSPTFNTDLSGVLIPYLQKGSIKIIASITPTSFSKFVEPKHTLESVFEIVKFEEPDKDSFLRMLLQKTAEVEKKSKVSISYKAVVSVCEYAKKYLPDRVMPGSGVSLLEDSATAVATTGRKIVEEQDVLDKVGVKTKIAVGTPKEDEANLLLRLDNELSKYIIGQKDAISEISQALRRLRAGLNNKVKPISFLFLGPTGVGKTLVAKTLSNIYFGENKMIRADMSEYSTEEGVTRLLGGTIGSKGFTDEVHERPFSLVLLDEFEKANPKTIDLFLQVFDDGRLTNNVGKTVSFADAIIIATSNAASEYIREEVAKGTSIDSNFKKKLLEVLQTKGIFRPELLNRFDGIIVFKPLEGQEVSQIVKLLLTDLEKKLLEKDITVSFDEKVIEKIATEGFDQEFGARPLSRFIQNNIENLIAQKILKDEIKRGDKINISVDSSNNLQLVN